MSWGGSYADELSKAGIRLRPRGARLPQARYGLYARTRANLTWLGLKLGAMKPLGYGTESLSTLARRAPRSRKLTSRSSLYSVPKLFMYVIYHSTYNAET